MINKLPPLDLVELVVGSKHEKFDETEIRRRLENAALATGISSREARRTVDAGLATVGKHDWSGDCAHCGELVEDSKGIVWHLITVPEDTFFHPECAVDFALRLLRDVHEIQCKTGVRTSFVSSRR